MSLIGTLNTAVASTVIDPDEYNQNMDSIRDTFNTYAVLTDVARTITAQHTFNPGSAQAPFVLGANAQGQKVTGLNADELDGESQAYYRNASNLNAGTVPSARISGSYTGITGVGTLTTALVVNNVGPHVIGGSGALDYVRMLFTGNFTSGGASTQAALFRIDGKLTGAAGDTGTLTHAAFGVGFTTGNVETQGNSETVNLVSTLALGEPNITLGAGDSVTNAATLYISSAPSEASNNYALFVDNGNVRVDGQILVPVGSTGNPSISVQGAASGIIFTSGDNPTFVHNGTGIAGFNGSAFYPATDNSYSLGLTTFGWSDLYLGDGGTINWVNGDIIVRESAATLAVESSEDSIFRVRSTSATGSPFLSFWQSSTRRAYIRYLDSGDRFQIVSEYGPVRLYAGSGGSTSHRLEITYDSHVHIQGSPSDEQLRIDHSSGTGSPYISFFQNGTRRAFIQYQDSGDGFRMVNEYGSIHLYSGAAGTASLAASFKESEIQFERDLDMNSNSILNAANLPWSDVLSGSKAFSPGGGSLSSGSTDFTDITVTGAASGDIVLYDNPWIADDANLIVNAYVTSSNTVRVTVSNIGTTAATTTERTVKVNVLQD